MNRNEDQKVDLAEATIAELAQNVAERHKKDSNKAWYPALPFSVVMGIFTICVFSLAIIPTCVQVFSSASGSIDYLSGQILKSIILSLTAQLQQMLGSAQSTFHTFESLDFVKKVMENETTGYANNMEYIKNLYTIQENAPVPVNLVCTQNYNATGRAPYTGDQRPVTVFGGVLYYGYLFLNYCDYGNLTTCYGTMYDPVSGVVFPPYESGLSPDEARGGFVHQKLNFCGNAGTWRAEVFVGNGWMSYSRCAPPNEKGISLYACGGGFSVLQLPYIMSYLAPTLDSRVWLTTTDGRLISTNMNITNYPLINEAVTDFLHFSKYNDTTIVELSYKLMEGKTSWKDIPAFDITNINAISSTQVLPTVEYTLTNGTKWITIALTLTFGTPEKFFLIVSIPRNDFFGLVDSSIRNGITLSSVFSVIGVVTGLIVAVLVVIPMQRITANMKAATKFDFSMLQAGILRENSTFTEIRAMQRSFNTMVKAFAGAIKVNKNFSSRAGATSGVTSMTSSKPSGV